MKILQLRFKNLNSLYGEWFIDFSDAEYRANGIFALTGPTGAGKSTILDAICLALYGATPRLGKISKNNNDIMSRQTGECYAEVLFAAQDGQYRCHWSQHRARKKASGKLADSKHEISDARTEQVLESKKKQVAQLIEAKTGMDFERFTRSILLAQGGFDTFLKADAEQKSKILEQITGTEIYSKISRSSHERQRLERDKLTLLQAEIKVIVLLEPEQLQTIEGELHNYQQQQRIWADELSTFDKALYWLKSIVAMTQAINHLSVQSVQLEEELERFQEQRICLQQAVKAAELDAVYATLEALRRQQKEAQDQLKQLQAQLPHVQKKKQQQKIQLEKTEQSLQQAKKEQQTLAPLIQKVRLLDQQISSEQQLIEREQTDCQQEKQSIEAQQEQKSQLEKNTAIEKQVLKEHQHYLQEHAQDACLNTQLAGIEAQFSSLMVTFHDVDEYKKTIKNKQTLLTETKKKLILYENKCADHQSVLEGIQQQITTNIKNQEKVLKGQLLREYRAEKESVLMELSLLRKIADLESERQRLENGKSCPLCGALEHPYAQGNVPQHGQAEKQFAQLTQLITQVEQLEIAAEKLQRKEKNAQHKLSESEQQYIEAQHQYKSILQNVSALQEKMQEAQQRFDHLKQRLLEQLSVLGISQIDDQHIEQLLESLKLRLHNWQQQQEKYTAIEQQINLYAAELKTLEAVINTRNAALQVKQFLLREKQQQLEIIMSERVRLFADKNPQQQEQIIIRQIEHAESDYTHTRAVFDDLNQQYHTGKDSIVNLTERIEQYSKELDNREREFKNLLLKLNFTNEEQFIKQRLTPVKRQQLADKAQALDKRWTEIQTSLNDQQGQLSILQAENVTAMNLEDVQTEQQSLQTKQQKLVDDIAAHKHQLEQNKLAHERIVKQQTIIQAQQTECQRWDKLHALIGSADGKKYRNFAQGLTFELMVSHANAQLKKMSDRYLLIRDNQFPLELNVIDNYQAGEIRSSKNLSGGESFIVSLTLALGLSKMASHKVRVDSLFLDEGFGTLDEETLETALETLSALQQDGKLIGVISHVPALKQRISTQINVSPLSGGKSVLSGPGCSRISN